MTNAIAGIVDGYKLMERRKRRKVERKRLTLKHGARKTGKKRTRPGRTESVQKPKSKRLGTWQKRVLRILDLQG
eukprot:6191240-Pleurochrysis_carterae.AAC.2